MTERACAMCVKRHAIPGRETGLGRLADVLECRANPPGLDVSGRAQFPQVKPGDYCWSDFALDAAAAKALAKDQEVQARLDEKVAETQARSEILPIDEGRAPEGSAEKPQRARRARTPAADEPKLDL